MAIYRAIKRAARIGIDRIPLLNRLVLSSAGYRVLTKEQAESYAHDNSAEAWSRAARRQEAAYARLLAEMRAGQPRIDFEVAAAAVRETGLRRPTLLEVGCGNGYYSEVLMHLLPEAPRYTGLDYSPGMIVSAKRRYPSGIYLAGDTTRLPFATSSFDIVMDGASLIHILDYPAAISEIARVATRFVVLHCVSVFGNGETLFLFKYAYGQAVVEAVFGAAELEDLCRQAGLEICKTWDTIPYDVAHVAGRHSRLLTYLLKKAPSSTRPKPASNS